MNRFFDVRGFALLALSAWEMQRLGIPFSDPNFETVGVTRFRSDIAGGIIEAPDRYRTNLASIPPKVQAFFMSSDDPRIAGGAIIHDYLYGNMGKVPIFKLIDENDPHGPLIQIRTSTLTRKQCDEILCHEAMKDSLATDERIFEAYEALRIFGDRWKDGQ